MKSSLHQPHDILILLHNLLIAVQTQTVEPVDPVEYLQDIRLETVWSYRELGKRLEQWTNHLGQV